MDMPEAVAAVLEGASMAQVAEEYGQHLIEASGSRPDEAMANAFRDRVAAFMRTLARHLGDRHAGDPRIGQTLRDWVLRCDHYEAWDALMSGFDVQGREALVRRGRMMFPGPLTAHWADE
jgi:hypothetical protein